MKANIHVIKKQRVYSVEFKREIVSQFESGSYSVLQLSKLYEISNSLIYDWIYKFSNFNEKGQRVVEMKASSSEKLKALEKRIKELERAVGQKQIKIDYLETLIDVASDGLKYDIRKNGNTPQSSGSENIRPKK
ncbi:transposase [Flavobacterium sp. HSC-61S13]|uniref:transposase n=1 Tax=Flavobacterium sp. HSC-61S13 TaxID=2910963 RepID=UPI00209DB582|nr:transposase [Flavobacterium sp. HSC-61S13]MCP1994256.1 transposase-like protein [Flavobacterium sp. HSC-61S13]